MKCPQCRAELVKGESKEFETLCEHVENPNRESYPLRTTYVCSDPKCETHKFGIFWNIDGELYCEKYFSDSELKFINDNDGPFGTIERRLQVEIYKKGVKKRIVLHPCLMLWFFKPVIEFNYQADEDGNVLKRTFSISIWKKEKNYYTNEYCVGATFWISTWKFLWKEYKRNGYRKSFNDGFPYRVFDCFIKLIK